MINNVVYLSILSFISIAHVQGMEYIVAPTAINKFSIRLLEKIYKNLPEEANVVLSPYAVWTTLAIVNEGAFSNTGVQLHHSLYIPLEGYEREEFRILQQSIVELLEERQEGIALDIHNELFIKKGAVLNSSFSELVRSIYHVNAEEVNFNDVTGTTKYINDKMNANTKGLIQNSVSEDIIRDTKMLLISSLFFKGLWEQKFDAAKTEMQQFYDEDLIPIADVPMMHLTGVFAYIDILHKRARAIELPYIGGRMSMIIVLPNGNMPLLHILMLLGNTPMATIIELFGAAKIAIGSSFTELSLPRFNISSDLSLKPILRKMGINDAFNEFADLSGISNDNLYISHITHKANIEVNEEGTMGGAIMVLDTALKMSPNRFNVNRPFAFFVVDRETFITVLSGIIYNPIM